jgi:hypothetical protein
MSSGALILVEGSGPRSMVDLLGDTISHDIRLTQLLEMYRRHKLEVDEGGGIIVPMKLWSKLFEAVKAGDWKQGLDCLGMAVGMGLEP